MARKDPARTTLNYELTLTRSHPTKGYSSCTTRVRALAFHTSTFMFFSREQCRPTGLGQRRAEAGEREKMDRWMCRWFVLLSSPPAQHSVLAGVLGVHVLKRIRVHAKNLHKLSLYLYI